MRSTIDPTPQRTAQEAARYLGRDPDKLRLIRAGSAQLYRLDDVAIRVAPAQSSHAAIAHQAHAARLLTGYTTTPVPLADAVTAQTGLVYSVWSWVPNSGPMQDPTRLGHLLAQIHAAPSTGLVSFDPLDLTSKRIADPDLPVTAHERSVIEHAYDIQHRNWEIHAAATAPGFVHGDFSAHNVLDTATGPVVIDFENTGQGNMLWDLVRIVHAPTRFANSATQAGREYAATLLDVYTRVAGPVDTGSLEDLISVVDLIGAVWTVAARSHDPWFEHESVIRLASLEDPTRPPDWSPR